MEFRTGRINRYLSRICPVDRCEPRPLWLHFNLYVLVVPFLLAFVIVIMDDGVINFRLGQCPSENRQWGRTLFDVDA